MKKQTILIYLFVTVVLISCSKSSSDTGISPSVVNDTPISGQFQKRVLVEDFTGAWCGWCPRVAYAIGELMNQSTKVVPVAIHKTSGTEFDPFDFPTSTALPLLQQVQLSSFPTGMLNRTILWNAPENVNISQVKSLTGNNVELGLAMNSSVSGGNINLNVNVKFAKDYTGLKLVVYVLENGLYSNQNNYTTNLYGTGTISPLVNFKYDYVLRSCLTNSILGDAITDSTLSGQTITKNFSVPMPSNITNSANISFVAFVVGSNNTAINVRSSVPGETQTFEQNP